MSHLREILNHDHGRPESSQINERTEPAVDRLDVASSPSPDEETPPISDDEIDELDEESEGGGDFYDEEPPTPLRGTTNSHAVEATAQQGIMDGANTEPNFDSFSLRKEEKRPEPAPRRKLEKHDRKIDLGLHDHKAHADCPDTLACLPDTHGRPQHTLPVILRCAILGSPRKRLTIREIYATMESKYPYYKTAGQTWKQSVRHHLSLNRLFERQPRPVTDPGFGSYWTVNLTAPPGTKRPRKRGRPNKDGADGTTAKKSSPSKNDSLQHQQIHLTQPLKFHFQPQSHPPPPPPPLPQPQVNTLGHHHHTIMNNSSPHTDYSEPHIHSLQQASIQHSSQANAGLPPSTPASTSSSTVQDHRRLDHHHPNHYQNHRQSQAGPHPRHSPISAPHLGHRQPLSPSIPTAPSHSHQYSQEQQQIYSHQRSHQEHYSPSSHQHPSQIVPSQPRPPLNHAHSQPIGDQRDTRRSAGTYPQQRKGSLPLNSTRETAYSLSSKDSDGDEMMILNSGGPTISVSDDEFESEEDTDNHYSRRPHNGTFVPTKPSPIFPLPPFSVLTPPQRQDLLEQMRQEIADLRRTSAEAVSTSIRLSEQLANANLEVSRSREAVRDLEDMLEDEAAQRKELEKLRTLEVERRRAAEDALSSTIRSPAARVRAT